MKKLLIIILILTLFLPIIEAKIVNITKADFYIESRQAYTLYEGDGVSFTKDSKDYTISIDEIGKSSVRLKSFGYKNNNTKETFYIYISENSYNKIDFEKDDVYDMQVSLFRIKDNRTKADILFEALNEAKTQDNEDKPKNKLNNAVIGSIIAISIVVLGLIIYFVLKKK